MNQELWAICLALPHEFAGLRSLFSIQAQTTYHGAVFREGVLGKTRAVIVQTGVGPKNAMRSAEFLFKQFPVTHLMTSGYCGALIPEFHSGEALVAEGVALRETREVFPSAPEWLAKAEASLREAGLPFRRGTMVTSPQPVFKPEAKQALGREFKALGVDMESAAILSACVQSQKKIASITVRFVVDEAADDWGDTQSFIDENAAVKPLQLLRTLVKKPKLVLALPGLEQKAAKGRKSLTKFFEGFFGVRR